MSRVELPSHERAFDFFRRSSSSSQSQRTNVDWVKLQVYGKDCVPEEFPADCTSLPAILDRLGK